MAGKTWIGLALVLAGAAVTYHDGHFPQLMPEQRMSAEPWLRSYLAGPALVILGVFAFLWPRTH